MRGARRAVFGRRDVGSLRPLPSWANGRVPSAPNTVSTSVSPTCAITRAWLIRCPRTTSSRVELDTAGADAYDRYSAVAHTHGRPVSCSSTSIAAPRPQPPNSAPRPEVSPGTIGIRHLAGVVGAFESEERQRIHRRRTLPNRPHHPRYGRRVSFGRCPSRTSTRLGCASHQRTLRYGRVRRRPRIARPPGT